MKTLKEDIRRTLPLPPVSIEQIAHARNAWIITVPVTFPYEALLEPRMWGNVSMRLSLRDSIEVWCEDLSWAAEFRVIDKGNFGVKVAEWNGKKEFATVVPNEIIPDGYQIDYKGPMLRYCVTRKADSKRIYEKGAEQASAVAWLASHLAGKVA